jgi:glycosyltransferase involved in cell wall biosynthesis
LISIPESVKCRGSSGPTIGAIVRFSGVVAIVQQVTRGRPTSTRGGRVLADGWYSWTVHEFVPLTRFTDRLPGRARDAVLRIGPLRALLLMALGTRFDAIAVIRTDPGWRSLLLLRALLGRGRRLVVFHFIDHPDRQSGLGRWVDRGFRPLDRWATRRAVRSAQTLTEWERARYARAYSLGDRFHFIPFAWRSDPDAAPPDDAGRAGVVAAGRASCDWPTLFAAARGAGWPLTVVCGPHDHDEVTRLNADGRATVLCDIHHDEARALLRGAAVCVLAMRESQISHGHVRLCDAVDAGAAVVASATRSLDGYVVEGETALLVPVGDAAAMRVAIDSLVSDPEQRAALAAAAFARASAWTWTDYASALVALTAPLPGTSGSVPAAG